jgi:hypothetical protein
MKTLRLQRSNHVHKPYRVEWQSWVRSPVAPTPAQDFLCHIAAARRLWPTQTQERLHPGFYGKNGGGKPEVGGVLRGGWSWFLMWWLGPIWAVATVLGFGWVSTHHFRPCSNAGWVWVCQCARMLCSAWPRALCHWDGDPLLPSASLLSSSPPCKHRWPGTTPAA